MALQTINIGASANDGSGDPLRTAMDKVNDNFALLGAVFNVKHPDYGAVGDGVTECGPAFQLALDAAHAAGGGKVYIPAGTFRKTKNSPQLTMYSNTTLCGDGDCSVLYFDDDVVLTRRDLLNIHNTENVTFRDFKILGTADRDEVTTNQSQCLIGDEIDGLRIENMTFEGLRYMVTAFSYVRNGVFTGNRLIKCMRDGLRAVNSYNIIVSENNFQSVTDDAVALHGLDNATDPVGSTFVVTNNTFDACQGVKVLGAKNVTVAHNVFTRTIRNPIEIKIPFTGTEGNTPMFNIDVSHNVILDTFGDFGIVDAVKIESYPYVSVGSPSEQPGVNATPYAYNWLNNIDAGGVNVGAFGVNICDNIIGRSLPAATNYSDYGYGDLYDYGEGWPYDPEILETGFITHGITVSAAINGLRISGNQIYGLDAAGTAVRLTTDFTTGHWC